MSSKMRPIGHMFQQGSAKNYNLHYHTILKSKDTKQYPPLVFLLWDASY